MTFGAFQQDNWPGLAKLIEEAAEVTQVAAKLTATNGQWNYWGGRDLRREMIEELGDLQATIWFLQQENFESEERDAITVRALDKLRTFTEWHHRGENHDLR